jgi:hypothetical protein
MHFCILNQYSECDFNGTLINVNVNSGFHTRFYSVVVVVLVLIVVVVVVVITVVIFFIFIVLLTLKHLAVAQDQKTKISYSFKSYFVFSGASLRARGFGDQRQELWQDGKLDQCTGHDPTGFQYVAPKLLEIREHGKLNSGG